MKPKIIIFDCWDTIIQFHQVERNHGWELIFDKFEKQCSVTKEQFIAQVDSFLKEYFSNYNYEVPFVYLLRYLMEDLNLTSTLSYQELEQIYISNYNPTPMENLDTFLHYCEINNIRTAVISNTTMSESNTINFINGIIQKHNFEFILASSEIAVKKPNPRIFLLGVHKARVKPEEAMYIGDNFNADVVGSYLAGLNPVWLNKKNKEKKKDIPFVNISSYLELIDYLERNK